VTLPQTDRASFEDRTRSFNNKWRRQTHRCWGWLKSSCKKEMQNMNDVCFGNVSFRASTNRVFWNKPPMDL